MVVIMAHLTSTLANGTPESGLSAPLAALWWAAKGEWDAAHKIVQDESDPSSAWVHAYLHRVEGDLSNASVADLTFAPVSQRVLKANVKSKATLESIFTSVPLVLTFVNEPAAMAYECQNRDTSYWYRRAGQPVAKDSLESEWERIASTLEG
jgi:hypothetical protein